MDLWVRGSQLHARCQTLENVALDLAGSIGTKTAHIMVSDLHTPRGWWLSLLPIEKTAALDRESLRMSSAA